MESEDALLAVKRLGQWLQSLSYIRLILFIYTILIVKIGVSPIGKPFVGWLRDTALHFPAATTYLIASPGPIFLMRMLGYPSTAVWWGIGFVLYLNWIVITIVLIRRRFGANAKLNVILFLMSSPVACSMTMIGHIDIWNLTGASIAVLGRFRGSILLGAAIAAAGNIELNLATTALILILSLANVGRSRVTAQTWLPISLIAYITLHLIGKVSQSENVGSIVLHGMKSALFNSLGILPLHIYALYGVLWIPIILVAINRESKYRTFAMSLSLLFVPFLLSTLILDGTRVGITASFVCFLLTLTDSTIQKRLKLFVSETHLGLLFLGFVIIPTLIVDDNGILRLPYKKILQAAHLIS